MLISQMFQWHTISLGYGKPSYFSEVRSSLFIFIPPSPLPCLLELFVNLDVLHFASIHVWTILLLLLFLVLFTVFNFVIILTLHTLIPNSFLKTVIVILNVVYCLFYTLVSISTNSYFDMIMCIINAYTAISRKVGKSARDNPERHCGWFQIHCSSEKFERIGTKGHDNVFVSANGKQKKQA